MCGFSLDTLTAQRYGSKKKSINKKINLENVEKIFKKKCRLGGLERQSCTKHCTLSWTADLSRVYSCQPVTQ